MSLSAIIVMIVSIAALWGVASIALIYSMRQEDRKLLLLQEQGDFEPFSPGAQRDIEAWLVRHPESKQTQELRELLELQRQSRRNNSRHFYRWATQQ